MFALCNRHRSITFWMLQEGVGVPMIRWSPCGRAVRNAQSTIVPQSRLLPPLAGERGSNLSGGQKQRVALARAFLRQAPILILDEATSALDSESEALVQKALKKLMIGKTVLVIAHRFSTIRDAAMILVFQNSRLVASGSHSSLYESNALYKLLYDRQQTAA